MHLKHWTKSTTPEKLAKISDKFLLVMINHYHMDMVDKSKTAGERLIAERRARIFRQEFWRRRPLKKEDLKPIKILPRYYYRTY